MPGQLTSRLSPYLNATEIEGIFGSITGAVAYRGVNDAVFEGTVRFVPSLFAILSNLRHLGRRVRLCHDPPSYRGYRRRCYSHLLRMVRQGHLSRRHPQRNRDGAEG